MKFFYLICFLIASSSASAEEIVARNGGLFCSKVDDLLSIMSSFAAGKLSDFENTKCAFIDPGTRISVDEKFGSEDAMMVIGRTPTSTTGYIAISNANPPPKKTSEGRTFKLIDPRDVHATPAKWKGRDIEFRSMNVYWVDDADVRILTGTNLTLFISMPRGNAMDLQYLRENCETSREASSPKCKVNVRFNFDRSGEDRPNGYSTRTVLISNDAEILRIPRR